MMLAGLALAAAIVGMDQTDTALTCERKPVGEAFNSALSVMKKDRVAATATLDNIIRVCGDAPIAFAPRVLRADLALADKDHAAGLAALKPVPEGSGPLGFLRYYIELGLLAGVQDAERAKAVRSQLLAASGKEMTGPQIKGKFVETFKVGGSTVSAYEAKINQGAFVRHQVFLIEPEDPLALPTSMTITTNVMIALIEKNPPYIVDFYSCDRHVTVTMMKGSGKNPPKYADSKKAVVRWLEGKESGVSSTARGGEGGACVWPQFVTPYYEEPQED